MAVISLDFSSALTCPVTSFVRLEWALTMQGILQSFVRARLRSLPSMDIMSPVTSVADFSHWAACGRSAPAASSQQRSGQ